MSLSLRIILLIVSLFTAFFVFKKIKKSQFYISDTIFWFIFCCLLFIMSVFPKLTYWVSNLIGFEAPSNFVFVIFIFLLLIKVFLMSVKISKLESKLSTLVQNYAIDKNENLNNSNN